MSKSPTNEEIIELGEKIYEIIQKYLSSEDGWTFVEEIHDVKMYKRSIEAVPGVHEKGSVIMGVGFVPHATVDEFVDLVLDKEKRKSWDTADFYDVITTIDEKTDICHVGVPSYGPISARDFVSVRHSVRDLKQNTYIACQSSVNYPITGREHLVKKHVRGRLLPSCWKFQQMEGGCMAHYISGVHLGGWLPQALVDTFVYSNTHGTFFPNVRKVIAKMAADGTNASSSNAHSNELKGVSLTPTTEKNIEE